MWLLFIHPLMPLLLTSPRPSGIFNYRLTTRAASTQARADRLAQLPCCRLPTQVWRLYLPRGQHLLDGMHQQQSSLLFAKVIKQQLA